MGALTVGGATGHDNGVIPKSEAFFDLDHGWKTGETSLVRGVEFSYAQHWYWYQSARILSLTGTAIVYFPQNWTFTFGTTGSRSAFSGTNAEWRPSGIARLGFPLAHWGDKRLSGNVSFAAGTENFAIVDQIGSFASQTYGGGLRLQITGRQDLTGFAGYQRRTQNRTDTSFGLSYGIHFRKLWRLGPAAFVFKAIITAIVADGLLLAFIFILRTYRKRFFAKRDKRAFEFRQQWDALISGRMSYDR